MPTPKSYREMIAAECAHFRKLHERVHETFRTRDHSPKDYAEWKAACATWHSYRGRMDDFLHRVYSERPYTDPELLEFVIAFLEEDPRFFRSGYHKERILDRLKQAPLTEQQRRRLRSVLYDAALRRGTREYRRYCRLAAFIADDALVDDLTRLAGTGDASQATRAKLMLPMIGRRPGG